MGNLLEDFLKEGLLPERLVSPSKDNAPPPRVNPDMPQDLGSQVHDPKTGASQADQAAQDKADDPTKPADHATKQALVSDTAMKTAVSAMNCAECALEHVHGTMDKREDQYGTDKQQKIREIYESIKQLSSSLSSVNDSSKMQSPVQDQGQGQNPSAPPAAPVAAAQAAESKKNGFASLKEAQSFDMISIANPETQHGSSKLHDLDKSFIGTRDYMGLAYFWGQKYKYVLREVTAKQRKQIHDAFMQAKLPLEGDSDQHAAILAKFGLKV